MKVIYPNHWTTRDDVEHPEIRQYKSYLSVSCVFFAANTACTGSCSAVNILLLQYGEFRQYYTSSTAVLVVALLCCEYNTRYSQNSQSIRLSVGSTASVLVGICANPLNRTGVHVSVYFVQRLYPISCPVPGIPGYPLSCIRYILYPVYLVPGILYHTLYPVSCILSSSLHTLSCNPV